MNRITRGLITVGVAVLAMMAAATPAMADPKPVVPSTEQPTGAVPGGFSSWSELYAFQNRLNTAAERILAAGGAGNASVVAAPDNHELRIYWNGTVPAAVQTLAAGLDVPVKLLPARFTHRDLVQRAEQLAADPRVPRWRPRPTAVG
jgi:hypothetical protein